jgi:YceI-like domain
MKRALGILLGLGILALIIYLGVMKHLAEQRAARLDTALHEADARNIQMEADLATANQRAAELTKTREEMRMKLEERAAAAAPEQTGAGTTVPPITRPGAGGKLLYTAVAGRGITNLVRIEGTSSVHNWQVEARMIGGSVELPPEFLAGLQGQSCPTNLQMKANVFIPVRQLKSVEADGHPYSDVMDEIMYGKLLADQFNRITYTLDSVSITNSGNPNAALVLQATGSLGVAGVTNTISMPVYVTPGAEGRIQFSGMVRTKMTDFKIAPPEPAGMGIKTADDVTLKFWWRVKPAGK